MNDRGGNRPQSGAGCLLAGLSLLISCSVLVALTMQFGIDEIWYVYVGVGLLLGIWYLRVNYVDKELSLRWAVKGTWEFISSILLLIVVLLIVGAAIELVGFLFGKSMGGLFALASSVTGLSTGWVAAGMLGIMVLSTIVKAIIEISQRGKGHQPR